MALEIADELSPSGELVEILKRDAGSVFKGAGHHDIFVGRAPGRVDVMGGVVETHGGLVCGITTAVGAAVAIQRRDDHQLVMKSYNAGGITGAEERVEISLEEFYGTASLLPAETMRHLFDGGRHWAAYFAGAYPVLAKHKKLIRRSAGANIACYSNVPMGAGLGSSAAITCAGLTAMTAAYHLILEPMETALLAQKIETHVVGGAGGMMDAVTSTLGKKGELLVLDCQPHEMEEFVRVPEGVEIVAIYCGIPHGLESAKKLARVRTAASMAKHIMAQGGVLPEKITAEEFIRIYPKIGKKLPNMEQGATYPLKAAAEHMVTERERVRAFLSLMRNAGKDVAARIEAGRLMGESHRSYGEQLGLGCAEADTLVRSVTEHGPTKGFYGARITGEGSGGVVAVLMESGDRSWETLQKIAAEYRRTTGKNAALFRGSSPGAGERMAIKIPHAQLEKS